MSAEMVFIPSGPAILGTDEDVVRQLVAAYGIHPDLFATQVKQIVHVPGFWIDRFPVTNRAYRSFVQATGHRLPLPWLDRGYPEHLDDAPVTGVNYDDAVAYARWAGKRLPTEAEWEKAARGDAGLLWPWGNAWESGACASDALEQGRTEPYPVGAFSRDKSPYGVMDMAGNVCEWVDRPPTSGGGFRLIKGGSFVHAEPYHFLAATRTVQPPGNGFVGYIGFRCAKDEAPRAASEPADAPNVPKADPVRRAQQGGEERNIAAISKVAAPRLPLQPDLSRYGKDRITIWPVHDLDPTRALYDHAFEMYLSRREGPTLPPFVPWRVEIEAPYLPGNRFNLLFENLYRSQMQEIDMREDATRVEMRSRFPGRADVTIRVRGELDYVDVEYDIVNLGDEPQHKVQHTCFNALAAPMFRDHDGTRTFISTATGMRPIVQVKQNRSERAWMQHYRVEPRRPNDMFLKANDGSGGDDVTPTGPHVAIASRDGRWIVSVTALSGPPVELFNNREYSCLHCEPSTPAAPGERVRAVQRIYFLQGDTETLEARWREDFTKHQAG